MDFRLIIKKDSDFWVSLVLIILSLTIIREAFKLEIGTPNAPGSGFMIFGAGSILAFLSFLQLLQSYHPYLPRSKTNGTHRLRVMVVIIMSIFYIFSLRFTGYLLSTFLFLFVLFQVIEKRRWKKKLVGAAFTSLLSYILFARLLQLNLPKGWITFF